MAEPTLTGYWCSDTDFRGTAQFTNATFGGATVGRLAQPSLGGYNSAIVLVRPATEVIADLHALFNQDWLLGVIDNLLPNEVTRTSELRVGWRSWKHVDYYDQVPARHQDLDLLLRVDFDIHVNTPGWCLAVDGDIAYYAWYQLAADHTVVTSVDGWAFHTSYGSACREGVRDRLRRAVPAAVPTVQSLIDFATVSLRTQAFSVVYLVLGPGERTGTGSYDTNNYVSMAAVPRLPLSAILEPWAVAAEREGA